MKTKDSSVNVTGMHPEVVGALAKMEVCRSAALSLLLTHPMVVTSGKDGVHKPGSLHYAGLAVDLRFRDFMDEWARYMKNALGEGWDIVVEADHIHVERDPEKKPLDA